MSGRDPPSVTRRRILKAAAAAVGSGALQIVRPAQSTPAAMQAAIRTVVGENPINNGKVTLEIPPLVENGSTVACSVTVDSPMTPSDYVKAIHIFNEKNPQPNVISVHLGPRAGRARFSTRIRLADTQRVIAIAQLSDGSFWSGSVDVVITLGACLEDS
jgi:sulfur-oxidizing protein SoxY